MTTTRTTARRGHRHWTRIAGTGIATPRRPGRLGLLGRRLAHLIGSSCLAGREPGPR